MFFTALETLANSYGLTLTAKHMGSSPLRGYSTVQIHRWAVTIQGFGRTFRVCQKTYGIEPTLDMVLLNALCDRIEFRGAASFESWSEAIGFQDRIAAINAWRTIANLAPRVEQFFGGTLGRIRGNCPIRYVTKETTHETTSSWLCQVVCRGLRRVRAVEHER